MDGTATEVGAGDVCLLASFQRSAFHCSDTEPATYLSVLFTLKNSLGIPLRSLPGFPAVIHEVDVPYVKKILKAVVYEIKRKEIGYLLAAKSKVQELLVHFARHVQVHNKWQMHPDFRLQPIVEHLTVHPDVYLTTAIWLNRSI